MSIATAGSTWSTDCQRVFAPLPVAPLGANAKPSEEAANGYTVSAYRAGISAQLGILHRLARAPHAPIHWSSLRPTGQASQMELPTSPNAPQKVAWHLFFPFVVRDLQTLWPFFLTFPEPFTAFDRER